MIPTLPGGVVYCQLITKHRIAPTRDRRRLTGITICLVLWQLEQRLAAFPAWLNGRIRPVAAILSIMKMLING